MEKHVLTLREIQLLCLDMLREVDKICKAENIQYFLSGGTLLGAVRHQGFIPWDDDIDIMMPRPDYERFCRVAPDYLPRRYLLATPWTLKSYGMPWARIWDMNTNMRPSRTQKVATKTLFLDVLPIEGLPDGTFRSELFYKKIRAHDILLKCARRKDLFPDERYKALKRVLMVICGVRSPNSWAKGLDRAARRRSFYVSKYAGVCLVTHYASRERMPAEVFRGSVSVTFEGETYPAPIGYATYLSGLYGDYMKLPPEDQRYSKHNMEVTMRTEEDG